MKQPKLTLRTFESKPKPCTCKEIKIIRYKFSLKKDIVPIISVANKQIITKESTAGALLDLIFLMITHRSAANQLNHGG